MRYAITWLLFAILVILVIGSLNWPAYYRMTKRGIRGTGTVVQLLPEIHNTVRYEYQVAGQKFEGQMQSWSPNPALEQLSVGQSLVIYYDPQHPEESVLGEPRRMLDNETISVALAAFGVPTIAVIGWALRSSRRRANQRMNANPA